MYYERLGWLSTLAADQLELSRPLFERRIVDVAVAMLSKLPSQLLVFALIASLLTSQFLSGMHAHAGMGMDEAANHSARPHVHLGSLHKHRHGSGLHQHVHDANKAVSGTTAKKTLSVAGAEREHDADAFYFSTSPSMDRKRSASGLGQTHDELTGSLSGWMAPLLSCWGSDQEKLRSPPIIERPACALYLLHLSIRC